jgi:hypothetical protein
MELLAIGTFSATCDLNKTEIRCGRHMSDAEDSQPARYSAVSRTGHSHFLSSQSLVLFIKFFFQITPSNARLTSMNYIFIARSEHVDRMSQAVGLAAKCRPSFHLLSYSRSFTFLYPMSWGLPYRYK